MISKRIYVLSREIDKHGVKFSHTCANYKKFEHE
jgi:hypothetical protein